VSQLANIDAANSRDRIASKDTLTRSRGTLKRTLARYQCN